MTTNGVRLPELAHDLAAAGLQPGQRLARHAPPRDLPGADPPRRARPGARRDRRRARRRARPGEGQLRRDPGRQRRRGRRPGRVRPRAGRRRALHRVHAARRATATGRWTRSCPSQEILERIDAVFPLEDGTDAQPGAHVEPAARFRYRDGIGRRRRDRQRHRAVLRAAATGSGSPPRASSAPACSRSRRPTCGPSCGTAGPTTTLAAAIEAAVGTKWAGHRIGQVTFVRPGPLDEPDRRLGEPARARRAGP